MKCWVCARQARGFGHTDGRYRPADPRRYPIDWAFCSARCQDAFHKFYGHWKRAQDHGVPPEDVMVDVTPMEQAAMYQCLRFFGEATCTIGVDKSLGAYSEAEALAVIEAIVTAFTDEMTVQHERSKYPPMRTPGTVPVGDPIRSPESGPFADFKDDLPWETS